MAGARWDPEPTGTWADSLERPYRLSYDRAVELWRERPDGWDDEPGSVWDASLGGHGRTCGTLVRRGPWAGNPCLNPAGLHTDHRGWGSCLAHGGAKLRGRAEGAWLMAHAFARELDLNPWEALLKAVRIAAGKSAYCEWVLAQAKSDLEIEGRVIVRESSGEGDDGVARLLVHPDTGEPLGVGAYRDLSFWVAKSELWHERLVRTAKAAVDAGVAAWQVRQVQEHAEVVARVLNGTLEALRGELTDELELRIRAELRRQLLDVDAEQRQLTGSTDPDAGVVDSTWEG